VNAPSTALEPQDRWVENRPGGRRGRIDLRALWSARELVYFLALRDLKARYKQAAFGLGWAILQPLAGAAVFAFVFGGLAGVSGDGMPYPVFALTGFVAWNYFSQALGAATNSLVLNTSMITKVYFPRIAAPVAAILPPLVNLGVGLVLIAVAMVAYGVAPTAALAALPLCVAFAMLAALGPGLILATLHVAYRDVAVVIGFLTQLWLLASPIAYSSALVSDGWRWVYSLNPMVGVIDLFRWSVAGGPWPGPYLLASVASTIVLVVVGIVYFAGSERRFADVI
jgi:ABC-type polysaccharide/polyol phosphate export permease